MSFRKILVGIFMAGIICCGIGAGVTFQEYSSFKYMGEKRIGSNKIAEKTLTENLYTDKTKKLNTSFIAYNNENENIELKTSKSVPKDKIQIKVRYDADNVKVTINVTKYDLAKIKEGQKADITIAGNKYEGEVSEISKVATKNANGASVVSAGIKIMNPDSNIILGTEADVVIHTAKAENALILPIEAVNTDRNGSFVYAIENGVIVRKNVKTGITSDTEEEVKTGISEKDQVLTDVTGDITEGMKAASKPSESGDTSSAAAGSATEASADTASTAVSK